MSITKRPYGEFEGKEVFAYTLDNGKDLTAEIITYGGIVTRLIYKGTDVVLGWDNLDGYVKNNVYFGAIIGRNSNRIENAEFELKGKTYKLDCNQGPHNHHGGLKGFDKCVWDAETIDADEPSLVLTLTSPDGDQGFPGEVKAKVTYTVTANNSIRTRYEAVSDQDTIINLTGHSYFNLNGHGSGTVENFKVQLNSSFYLPVNIERVPTGAILPVDGTPFDMREGIIVKDFLTSDHEQIKPFKGPDHTFVVDGRGFRKAAVCTGDKSGIVMETYTDCPGVQIYVHNHVTEGEIKDGKEYPAGTSICFETQAFPNAMKHSHFPTTIVKAGEKYDTTTEYVFK